MGKGKSVRALLRVEPGTKVGLADIDPASTPGFRGGKGRAGEEIAAMQPVLADLQERLWAEDRRSVLLLLQGMDTSGKGGVIEHVVGAVNPQGCRIVSFKAPSEVERRHHFLWRIRRALPEPGSIGIFDRSQYEDVLVVRVKNLVPKAEWTGRYEEINRFEAKVAASGTMIVKVCLHISYDEQRERMLARLDDPAKRWKFREGDLDDRALWPKFQRAYEAALTLCSTETAPWHLVPANRKWYRNWAISRLLVETLQEMAPQHPEPVLDMARLKARLAPPD